MYSFAGSFIYANFKKTPKNHNVCEQMAVYLLTKSIKIEMLIAFSLFLMYCVPLYNISIRREYDVIIPIILPYLNPKSQIGFCANLANQLMFCVYVLPIMFGIELITCLLKNTISVAAAVIQNEVDEFAEILSENDDFTPKYAHQFQNILVKIMDFDRLFFSTFWSNIFAKYLSKI